jgi:hypothetical protein
MATTQHFRDLLRNLEELLAEPHSDVTAGLQQKYTDAHVAALTVGSRVWSNKSFKDMVLEKVSTAAYA